MMLNKVSLNTIGFNRIGLNRIGKPSRASSDRPYIDPEVLASLKAVCICYGKSNDDPDRAIVKNLVDPDNPFVISNAAYTEGSGYADKDSPYYGAFVTDGVNDLITSTKSATEMLDGSNEITVVSLITHISGTGKYNIIGDGGIQVSDYSGQTFMAGTSSSGEKIVELGDKEKLQAVQYTTFDSKLTIGLEDSSYAYYGTFVFNKENVPVDWIHQVIAYFNLDRTLNPDILCNTIKQGITNENHAEFGDKLIDFSGNGRDIQLNNIAWDGDSGIGKYNYPNWKVTATIANTYSTIVNYPTVNGTYSINVNGVSELMQSIGLHLEIRYTTSAGFIFNDIKQDGVYSYILPDGATDLTLRFGGIPGIVNEPCNITITQIPSHAGGLCLDGINDFGKVTGMPIYKDYTVIADYERFYLEPITGGRASILSKSSKVGDGSFIFNLEDQDGGKACYTFGGANGNISDDITRIIRYQSKYYNTKTLSIGTAEDNDFMVLGKVREVDSRHFCGAIYSLMSFPYSMSEFLIERQLKKHKLGTLYPDMVEFRPVIKANASYDNTVFYYKNEKVENGTYLTVGSSIGMHIRLSSNPVNEIKSITVNGIPATFVYHDANSNVYQYTFNLTSKSPQKINITIDEYIRFEDIVQPYPVLLRFKDENGNEVSWGGKFKVGSTITRIGSIADPESNLLNGLYSISGLSLNGKGVTSSTSIVEKQMVFKTIATYLLDNNEPNCILSPRLLRIPNSSYKILGHIPDISGHGNHGVIHNSAYGEGSGVNEDGSYQFDGVDDFVTIPTTVGGKQVLMKVNWQNRTGLLYDQRKNGSSVDAFAILNVNSNNSIAYNSRNTDGETYIDGILNKNIVCPQLYKITHSITIINQLANKEEVISPTIGSDTTHKVYFSQMSLYDFMLFDNISTDDKIKELNEYVGIEGNVWGTLTQLSNSTLISNETLIKNE